MRRTRMSVSNQDKLQVCPYGSWYMVGLEMYWKQNPLLKLTEQQQREHNIAHGYHCPTENERV